MKTKLIFTAALLMLVFNFTSCNLKTRDSDREQVGQEIIESIKEALAEINDSTFNNVNITTIDEDGNEVIVHRSEISPDENGNLNMNINVTEEEDSSFLSEVMALGFVVILFTFFSPVTIVFIICYFIYRNKRDRNRVIETSLTTGHELPKEFYTSMMPRQRLQSGIAYLAWGVGLFIFFMCIDSNIAWLCIIPSIIGIGKITAYFLYEHKRQNTECKNLSNVE